CAACTKNKRHSINYQNSQVAGAGWACENNQLWVKRGSGPCRSLHWRYRLGVQDAALSRRKPGFESRYRYQSSKGCKFPKKTEESVAGAGIVTTPCKKVRLFFLSTEYYLEGVAVVNTIVVMIRARLNGNYPFLPAAWNSNGRLKPNVALVN